MVGSMDHRKPAVLTSKFPQTKAKRSTMPLSQGPPDRELDPVYLISHMGALVTHLLCRGSQRAPELRQRHRQGKLGQDGWQVMGRELAGELFGQWGVPRADNSGHNAISHAHSNRLGEHNDNRMKYGDPAGLQMDRVAGTVPQDVAGATELLSVLSQEEIALTWAAPHQLGSTPE